MAGIFIQAHDPCTPAFCSWAEGEGPDGYVSRLHLLLPSWPENKLDFHDDAISRNCQAKSMICSLACIGKLKEITGSGLLWHDVTIHGLTEPLQGVETAQKGVRCA